MADNIQIVGNILNTTTVSRYSAEDTKLISSQNIQEHFGEQNDYIEYYIYDIAGNLLNTDYNYLNYKLPPVSSLKPGITNNLNNTGNIQTTDVGIVSNFSSQTGSLYPIIEIDPVQDLQNLGYSSGEFTVKYNFFQNKLSNNIDTALFVKEISSDRTEIRLASTTLTNDEIEQVTNDIINEASSSLYNVYYLLNFVNNEQYVTVNIALNKATTGYEILFKLYEPLPISVQEKLTLWIVGEKVDPYTFDINLDKLIIAAPPPTVRGPNFNIPIDNQNTVATTYNSYSNLVTSLQQLQNNSYTKILNLLNTQSIAINVDYTDFNNFIFFSSAQQRVVNFYGKIQQIEGYNNLISTYTPQIGTYPSLQIEVNKYSSSINNIITQFDGYESYLYFNSSSYSWPKSGSNKPYILFPSTSSAVLTWYNSLTSSANNYDLSNPDNLIYAVPSFTTENDTNQPFTVFLNMIGHYFDNIWIYLQSITDLNVANNNLDKGISKDLVYEKLRSLGIKLYNSKAGDNYNQHLIGANTGSSIFDNNFTITGSYLNNIPSKDITAELYKRIYHNLPLLVKTKGTVNGLQTLITTFGITSSILGISEYGGATKAELLTGYNNDKVRIISNPIIDYSGSFILSNQLSLQTYPTSSNLFRDKDTHYVDISFSPQTQIDKYISSSIASNNPTFNLDNYIGDPRQKYSSSYDDLTVQRNLYFQTGVSGYPGFTGSLMDYNGFIRLIQYFDNSLFKMLGDFVPERTSLSTGVTIASPVLERNKVTYARPNNTTTQSVQTAEFNTSSISSPYEHFYDGLAGDKKPYYSGELSGSELNIYNTYFIPSNYNPYLENWNVYNLQYNSTQSIDLNRFLHSDFNVLLNNVSQSVASINRNKIEYIYGTTGSIITTAQLQDSYLSLQSHKLSRYEGVQTTSLLYNTYTSASSTYGGDISYGNTAAIDHTVRKIGLFTQIQSSSFLPGRNNISLKYLVDEFGSLTELNQMNKHWNEVQNTLKSYTITNISLFDNKKYSNQKFTDGNKIIFESGYTYSPILYFSSSCVPLSFQNLGTPSAYLGTAVNSLNPNNYISGSGAGVDAYPISASFVSRLFDQNTQGLPYLSTGSLTTSSIYTAQETSAHKVSANFNFNLTINSSISSTFTGSLILYKSSSLGIVEITGARNTFTYSTTPITFTLTGNTQAGSYYGSPVYGTLTVISGTVTAKLSVFSGTNSGGSNSGTITGGALNMSQTATFSSNPTTNTQTQSLGPGTYNFTLYTTPSGATNYSATFTVSTP